MTSEAPIANVNGSGSKSLAAMLEEQHARDTAHKVTIEDTVDEEDLKHPPPSFCVPDKQPIPSPPAEAPAPSQPAQAAPKKAPAFDVRSEELFPALGSGPKPQTPAAATWGAKKSVAAAVANGVSSNSQSCMLISTVPLALF